MHACTNLEVSLFQAITKKKKKQCRDSFVSVSSPTNETITIYTVSHLPSLSTPILKRRTHGPHDTRLYSEHIRGTACRRTVAVAGFLWPKCYNEQTSIHAHTRVSASTGIFTFIQSRHSHSHFFFFFFFSENPNLSQLPPEKKKEKGADGERYTINTPGVYVRTSRKIKSPKIILHHCLLSFLPFLLAGL